MIVKLHVILALLPLCCVLSQNSYTYYPDIGYYKYHNETKTWFDAWTACYNERANLVVINTQEERDLIFKILLNYPGSTPWVGVHSLFENNINKFVTVHGERLDTLTHMQWYGANPSGMYLCVNVNGDVLMNNYNCTNAYSFICEIF